MEDLVMYAPFKKRFSKTIIKVFLKVSLHYAAMQIKRKEKQFLKKSATISCFEMSEIMGHIELKVPLDL